MTTPHKSTHGEALGQLSREIASAFSVAFFELDTIRSSAGELGSEVDRLVSAAAQEGEGGSNEAFVTNAASAAGAAEDAAGSLTDRAFQNALVSVADSLHEMKKCVLELASISSLTKITQPKEGEIHERLTVFTQTLDSRCGELREAASKSSDLITEIQRQSALARDQLTAIGREFRGISDSGDGQTRRLAELEVAHRSRMEEIHDDAQRLGTDVGRAVAQLIGCLQFPDAFAQRAEHVQSALDAMETASVTEKAAIATVVAAQLQSMADALTEVTAKADGGLGALSTTLKQSSVVNSHAETLDPSDAWMDACARANEGMLRSVGLARDKLGTALSLLSGLTEQIDTARANLEASVQLNRELETSVYNASIVASRSGSANSPLRFLAGAVKDVVGRSSGLIHDLTVALMEIRKTSEALGETRLEDDLRSLLEIQEAAARSASEQQQMVETVRETRENLLSHASRLTGAATAGAHAFQAASDHIEALSDLARQVGAGASASAAAESDLGWLYALYTMEEERLVHREILGLPDETAGDEPEDADELDDFVL